ncbi:helix-turn-helix domain-containing protein [Deinococcus malanensis]|uniref:helix-turn-helix domain-containing protein n=1 Tax=Deinococcus malanensis TaxID=1706855 RepID=UPI003628E7A2
MSTQDVALRTKIRGDYLRALEDGNIALLPERTFARSYLQRYARELNLDPTPLLADFDRSVPSTQDLGMTRGGRTSVPPRPAGLSLWPPYWPGFWCWEPLGTRPTGSWDPAPAHRPAALQQATPRPPAPR